MITRHLRGTTAQNNALTLPDGRIAIDLEKKALRLHDGITPGGWENVGEKAVFTTPGPTTFIVGDEQQGYYGITSSEDLVSYSALSTLVGLSAGTAPYDTASEWLKFSNYGKTLYIARQPARVNVAWDTLDAVDLVLGTTVEIQGTLYKVRLMTGANGDPADTNGTRATTADGTDYVDNEWGRLLANTHVDGLADWGINLTNEDLIIQSAGDGYSTWCQETWATTADRAITRGRDGLYYLNAATKSDTGSLRGWRPVLEVI